MAGQVPLYDSFSAEYDVMVSWPGRLQRESPFLESELRQVGARRVLDVGSGTGWHAIHLAGLGYDTVGVDPSAEMVARAEANAQNRPNLSFIQAGFGGLAAALEGTFDAVLCLGNTLPHALGQAGLLRALVDMAAVLRPGGALIVQQLNYDRILSRGQRFLGLSSGEHQGTEYVFFRFYDYAPGVLTFNVVIQHRDDQGRWQHRVESTQLQPILSTQLVASLAETGFAPPRLLGSYEGELFRPLDSNDLLVVTRRGSEG
jgi:glycine/sarcosine N-methyltransferase